MKKFFSRKLLILAIASAGLYFEVLGEHTWLIVACVYIGIQGAMDLTEILKK